MATTNAPHPFDEKERQTRDEREAKRRRYRRRRATQEWEATGGRATNRGHHAKYERAATEGREGRNGRGRENNRELKTSYERHTKQEREVRRERNRRRLRLEKLYLENPECCTSRPPDEINGGKGKWMDLRNTYNLARKLVFSCIGIVILSLGIAVCRIGDVGVDPFTAMNMGFSESLGMNFGTFQLIVNAVILVAIFFMDKWLIGIGTIVNMVAVGYLIELFEVPLSALPAPDGNFLIMGIYLVVGTLLFSLGISAYLRTSMGVSPYDAIAPAIRSRFLPKVKYAYVRVGQDILFLVLALIAGGPFGIFTLIAAFFAGPLIAMWDKIFSKPIYTKLRVLDNPEITREFA